MKRLLVIPLLFVLATACGHRDKGFMPERLLSEREMIDVMTDVQIIEADINYRKTQVRSEEPQDFRNLSQSYYGLLFEHYGITDSIFSQNIRYYSQHPAILEKIMDSVTQRLLREQAEAKQ